VTSPPEPDADADAAPEAALGAALGAADAAGAAAGLGALVGLPSATAFSRATLTRASASLTELSLALFLSAVSKSAMLSS
jgi:uncharacterized protein YbjT (DUF2867 family)